MSLHDKSSVNWIWSNTSRIGWDMVRASSAQLCTSLLTGGHYPGIGLDGHERPYLRGNSDDVIQTGHTFSNEPGVYIEDVVGIRLEDCFYIAQDGSPSYFTGPQTSPWEP